MRARGIQRQCYLQLTLGIVIRMIDEVKFPKRFVKFRLIGPQLQSCMKLFEYTVEILAKGVAFGTQLVSTPGVGKRFLQSRIRLSPQRLVCARQPVAGLGVFVGDARHLR